MTTHRVEDLAPRLRSLLSIGSASGLTDGQLLGRFAAGDAGEAGVAFEVLVERHGPMVLRVCRGVLRDPHDAQDAFQATFLVLVRRAGSIRDLGSVASWLHGVALRVANHARAGASRRRRMERSAVERAGSPKVDESVDDLGPRLHEEVDRLPERYRAAVVLCYLEGHTCEDAARVLDWPVGTVKSRLSRARERLRSRLTRLGLAPALALAMPPGASRVAPLSPRLARATAGLATRFGARSTPPASALGAVSLAEGALKVMTVAKLRYAAFALLAAASWPVIAPALAPPPAIPDTPHPPIPSVEVARQQAREEPKPQAPAPDPIARTIPRDLSARAGGGTVLMHALDAKRERIGEPNGPWIEADVDLRWVAVVGVVDNQKVREALAIERKVDLSEAYPNYKRVEVRRQSRRPGEDWSGWEAIDFNKNYEVLDNLPRTAPERTPEQVRPPALVDPLPFLKKGAWDGVDPEPVLRLPDHKPDEFSADNRRLHRSPLLAIRHLDFTVEPGTTYRYRVRVVVANPDVARGVKRESLGPWSEPTKGVAVP